MAISALVPLFQKALADPKLREALARKVERDQIEKAMKEAEDVQYRH